mmetsp:Transcript_21030/g.62186  ORF Transcript_21030/g.62186 Transcript_21030/m.62186 type:complete len:656 (-) Transcript_21030:95-2062(-)
MPDKDKPKKKKMTKKEKEAAKRAEMERLAEEQRLAEAAEAERQEQERLRKAEEARVAAEIAAQVAKELEERREVEDKENEPLLGTIKEKLDHETKKLTYEQEWEKYLACHVLPDVTSEAQVNTFITEWGEAPVPALEAAVGECDRAAELMHQLDEAHTMATHAVVKRSGAAWEPEALHQLARMATSKLDQATADILLHSDDHANVKNELQLALETDSLKYALWVNLARNPRVKSVDFPEVGISIELPKALALAPTALRLEQYRRDFASVAYGQPSSYQTLGGVTVVELLSLPPAPKRVKGMTLRQLTTSATSVQRQPYPIPVGGVVDPAASASGASNAPPLRLSIQLPGDVIVADKMLRVGWWDDELKSWSLEGVSEIRYEAEKRALTFLTSHLNTLAVLQQTHAELPYKRWVLTPSSPSHATLALQTQRYEVVVDVDPSGCCLLAPELPELASLKGARLPPTVLLGKLRESGINLCPVDRDALPLLDLTPKTAALESEALANLVLLAPYYRLAASRWNASRPADKAVVRVTSKMPLAEDDDLLPSPEPKPVDRFAGYADEGWVTLLVSHRYAALLQSGEEDETIALDVHGKEVIAQGHVAHGSPMNCFQDDNEDLVQALTQSSAHYQGLLQQLLGQLRVLSFGAGVSAASTSGS